MIEVKKVPAEPEKKDMKQPWFVRFKFTHDGKEYTIKQQRKINYEKNFVKKKRKFDDLKKAVENDLAIGWNPVTNKFPANSGNNNFNSALDYALTKGSWSSRTLQDYSCTVRFVKKAATEVGLSNKPVKDIERPHIKAIMERVKQNQTWSNKAYNKNLGYLQAVMSQLMEWEIIKYNPAHGIKSLPVAETQKYIPYTPGEREKIKTHFAVNHYRYFVLLMVIYHTGIRPKEVLSLKIEDIDLLGQVINILPDIQEENSKTKSIRRVPINNALVPLLASLDLPKYPSKHYVFGSPFEPGKGNRGSQKGRNGILRSDYFFPSPTMIKRDTITKFWNKVVMVDLKINKHQYAAKHSGADAKILAGIDIDALKELYGHSSKQMTEKYITVLKEINRKKIIEGSPDF